MRFLTLTGMPLGLKRHQTQDHDHFVTFSCYRREPYLTFPSARDLFERSFEQTRRKYNFDILAYVIMPEHVHLLVSEPSSKPLATALQALKLSVSKQSKQRPFWQVRYYDFNVFTQPKRVEKIRYMHRNPVTRGLVLQPEDWSHSSFLTLSPSRTKSRPHLVMTLVHRLQLLQPLTPKKARRSRNTEPAKTADRFPFQLGRPT